MNESRRVLKKIFIAVIYLAVFAGLGTGIYFLLRPTPPLSAPPTPVAFPIEVIWSQIFVTGPELYSVAAKIKNPNTNFSASNFSYTFYLYDANGILLNASLGLSAQTGESFIWPGETKYIILGGINLTKAPTRAIIQLGDPAWHEIEDFKGIDLTLGNINYGKEKSDSGKFFSVNAVANNDTPYDLNKVYISAVILDKDGLPITVASTLLENLKSKERRPFNIPWFSVFSGIPDSVDLTITTNLWETPSLIGQ